MLNDILSLEPLEHFDCSKTAVFLTSCPSCFLVFHVPQPDELTNALEISNIVFTSLFSLEMLLKLLVYGPFGYIKNPYNIFDGIIVIIRYVCASAMQEFRSTLSASLRL